MARIVLVVLLVTLAAERVITGTPCRFDSSSASRGSCIFPCHCTKGCDQVTGECVKDGKCSDVPPSGYKWSGTACQIGNVALHKTASQSTAKWNEGYPASKAVDGSIDRSYQKCAVPEGERGTNAWWKIDLGGNYKISRVIIYNGNKECKAGYFGWRCRFKCDKCPTTCNAATGICPKNTCRDNRWGVGCMLKSECTYNDRLGTHYMGRTHTIKKDGNFNNAKAECRSWLLQNKHNKFIDGSRGAAGHHCRNPDNDKRGTWCYYTKTNNYGYCALGTCACDSRRFGINCEKECHCNNENENCQTNSPKGRCTSGCAPHFTGQTCQECEDGHFGVFCDGTCHCIPGSCDKKTGHCRSGCATGWTGDNCQKDERGLSTFTLSVGNNSHLNDHTQCASHNGAVAAGATVNESCTAIGRYLSFRRSGGGENHLTTLCEVVVIGHRYISCQNCSSTCNDVIGCDECPSGKKQPDCKQDCDVGNYGINCQKSCGHCKEMKKCSVTTGKCLSGCETWYLIDFCTTHIAKPRFQSPIMPNVADVTSSNATVSWPKASDVSAGLENHYHYVLWLKSDGGSENNVTRVEQGAGGQRLEARITGLTFNTKYSLRVEPYRENNGEREGGASTGVAMFKTTCIAPFPTVIKTVSSTIPGPKTNGSIVVNWQVITNSGCDSLTAVRVEYKLATTDSWKSVKADSVSQTSVTIDNLSRERYELRLVVINNKNIKSTSPSRYVDFRITVPGFRPSVKADVYDVTSSNATVSWPKAANVSSGQEDHYHYVLWLKSDGGSENNVTEVEQDAGEQRMEARITGLTFNTKYLLRVEPYRELNGKREGGASTQVVTFKTKCIAPSPATIKSVTTPAPTATAGIVVNWQVIAEIGCDSLTAVRVDYKQTKWDSWKSVEAVTVTKTHVTIENLSNGQYEVRLVVTNNENIASTSASKHVDVKKPTTADQQTSKKNTAVIAGSATGVIVLLAVVSVVVIVVFLRRRRKETDSTPDAAIEAIEDAGQPKGKLEDGNDAVPDTSGMYVNTKQLTLTRGIKVGDLAAYVEDKKRHNGFQTEFAELPPGVRAKCEAAHKPGNKIKNRFVNIVAYDHTRVVLSTDNVQSDYVNANHIMGYEGKENVYIATQGPKEWTIENMWQMVWQEKTNTIVMLANLYELGKEKCNQYWPDKGKSKTWGNFLAESTNEEQFADYVIREFSLKNQGLKKMRKIRQLHFTAWPDKGTPDYAYPLLAFHRKVHSFDSERRGPLLVHCSAGVGRTGTFIAIDILTQQAAAEGKIDVFQCVEQLRTQRMDMVQTLEQYVYVFQALVDSSEVAAIPCSQLNQSFQELCKGNKLDQQFKRLNALKTLAKNKKGAALEPNNVDKNRFIEIIPDDQHRPFLMTPWKEGTNYINAVTVHGYKQRNAYILTQSPMTTTVVDLWRLLNDHESCTVVMLDDVDDTDGYAIYWPTKKEPKSQYGPFEVELTETNISENTNVTMRDFKLTKASKPDDTGVTVRQFHLKTNKWNRNDSVPSNKMMLLDLLDLIEKWQQQNGNGPITMHCSDGASRCGVLVAASYILEHLKLEQEVDVFHAVQHVRTTRPQLVSHLEQYRFLYQMALAYMSQFDTYANFQ